MNISICAGMLKHRAVIETQSDGIDDYGQQEKAWLSFATVWCHIKHRNHFKAMELFALDQSYGRIDSEVTIRYRGDIDRQMRVSINGKFYHQVAPPENIDEQNKWLLLRCRYHEANNLG